MSPCPHVQCACAGEVHSLLDDFTARHLAEYADRVCYDLHESDVFQRWVGDLDADDLAYYIDGAGWPAALEAFRKEALS